MKIINQQKIKILKRLITLNKQYQSLVKYYQDFKMKYSLIVANLLYKVDINDYLGFALNYAINKYVSHKIIKEANDKNNNKTTIQKYVAGHNLCFLDNDKKERNEK